MKALGIIASLRVGSVSARCLELAREWTATQTVDWFLFDPRLHPLPFCDGREDQGTYPPSVKLLRTMVSASDRLLFVTPTHNGSFSAVAKNIVELLGPDHLEGKTVGVIAISSEDEAAIAAMHMATLLQHCGCNVVPILGRLPFASRLIKDLEAPFARLYVLRLKVLVTTLVTQYPPSEVSQYSESD
ncbi:NADPH-dependent FMN reductase [Mesorhizobium sp.]|uniref:NADPH-dependent FMN reductase n=1 Tax=Mesorhizobium sp. TaxID=1871066 RepID=UPI000FE85586|nr:MAG: NADPH-dependent oxidoreductase [Mesorhizobium sp.]